MASKKSSPPADDVDAFVRSWKHPLIDDYKQVRDIILGVSPKISAGIKWNSLSFRTTEYFATIQWRHRDAVQLVFHRGAKKRDNDVEMHIPDPAGLMQWLASDRCLITLGQGPDVAKNRSAFVKIVKKWITYV